MIVENKDGKGNPYHDDASGEFTTACGLSSKLLELAILNGKFGSRMADLYNGLSNEKKRDMITDIAAKLALSKEMVDQIRDWESTFSLRNFKEYAENKKRRLSSYYDTLSDGDEKILAEKFKAVYENSSAGFFIHDIDIFNLLSNGLKNQFETHKSGGCLGLSLRADASNDLFGSKLNTMDYESIGKYAEKYGCLYGNDVSLNDRPTQYGNVYVRVNKEKMGGRTTFTVGDSLGIRMTTVPAVLEDGFNKFAYDLDGFSGISGIKRKMGKDIGNDILKWNDMFDASYTELQFHGDVKADVITDMYMPEFVLAGYSGDNKSKLLSKLKEFGINLYTYASRYEGPNTTINTSKKVDF